MNKQIAVGVADCIHESNPMAGFIGSHNGRCSRGLTSPDVHLRAEYHARVDAWCGHVCQQCARDLGKRSGSVIRLLTTDERIAAEGPKL